MAYLSPPTHRLFPLKMDSNCLSGPLPQCVTMFSCNNFATYFGALIRGTVGPCCHRRRHLLSVCHMSSVPVACPPDKMSDIPDAAPRPPVLSSVHRRRHLSRPPTAHRPPLSFAVVVTCRGYRTPVKCEIFPTLPDCVETTGPNLHSSRTTFSRILAFTPTFPWTPSSMLQRE